MYNDVTIISGFPGIGKSRYAKINPLSAIDLDSALFPKENNAFPTNYADEIEKLYKEANYRYIFISCHESIRKELTTRKIPYIIVAPYHDIKNEYLKRYLKRGSSVEFISKLNQDWMDMINSMYDDKHVKICLGENEYLADVLI